MPPTHIQSSFAGGELSPYLYSRVDLAKYSIGLKRAKNCFIHPHGGISNLPGTYFVARQGDETERARTIPFIFSKTQAYTLEFGDHYIRPFTDQSPVLADTPASWNSGTAYTAFEDYVTYNGATYYSIQSGTNKNPVTETTYWREQEEYEIYSPYGVDDLPDLYATSSADTMYITHPDYAPQKLVRYGNADWRFEDYFPTDGPWLPENVDESISLNASAVTGDGVTLSAASAIFDVDHVGSIWKLIHYVEGQAASTAFTSATTSTSISCFTTWRVISHGTWTGKFNIEKSTDGGVTWNIIRTFTGANDFNVNTSGTEDIEVHDVPFLIRVNMYSYVSGTCNVDLTSDSFYQEGIVQATAFVSSTELTVTVLQDLASTDETISWQEGAWSDYRGWPAVSAFNQDRFFVGGVPNTPMRLDGSRTANYDSMGKNALSLLDTDTISTNLLSRQVNAINGLVPLGDLIAFTTASEWRVGPDSGSLTPTSVTAKPQGYRGSNGVKPIVIGNQIIYVQSNGKVVRNLGYEYNSDSYTGIDLRILASHLFEGKQVIDMAYQQDPDSLVWLLFDDGTVAICTYMAEQEVIAWSTFETDGDIESLCVVPADGYDEVWMSVNRATGRFIERLVERMSSEDIKDQFFVHCGLTYDNPIAISNITQADPGVVTCSAAHGLTDGDYVDISDVEGMTEVNGVRYKVKNATTYTFELTEEDTGDDVSTTLNSAYVSGGYAREAYTTFTGLDHLIGETVAILGDGFVYPQQAVNDDGSITLSSACSIVHAGLPYESDVHTLDINLDTKEGAIKGKKVKIGNVTFELINSAGGWIGPDVDNLHEAFIPERDSLGVASPLYSGFRREALGGEFTDGAGVYFRQYDPLPFTIISIISDCAVGG